MMRVRFYAEDPTSIDGSSGRAELYELLHLRFPKGCNVSLVDGLWEGMVEDSIVIEAIGDHDLSFCDSFAEEIKKRFSQDFVLYTREIVETNL